MSEARVAYGRGWSASMRTTTGDLDSAESRYLRRHGHAHLSDFLAGWSDHASGAAKWTSRKGLTDA
jgi:hypothetical protein